MAEEFQESEVVFQENMEHDDSEDKRNNVNTPVVNVHGGSWFRRYSDTEFGEVDDGEVVPPHVILAGKIVSFSVCTGNGRTLKGRDLSEVRNSILRMTGFLET